MKHVKACGGLLSRVQWRGPGARRLKLKHAWQWFVLLLMMEGCSQAVTNLMWTVVDWVASGSRPCIKGTLKRQPNLVRDFGLRLSSCVTSHISCPGWRNG